MEMNILQKSNRFNSILFYILLIVLLLCTISQTSLAEYFNSGLQDFIQSDRDILVPLTIAQPTYELYSVTPITLSSSADAELILPAGKIYYLSQQEPETRITAENNSAEQKSSHDSAASQAIKKVWGVQVMASSAADTAADYKSKLAAQLNYPIKVKQEADLYKVLVGDFTDRPAADKLQQDLAQHGFSGWVRQYTLTQIDKIENKNKEPILNKQQPPAIIDWTAADIADSLAEQPIFLTAADGSRIIKANSFELTGDFELKNKNYSGDFEFASLADRIIFNLQSNLTEITAYLLQHYFNPGAPKQALLAQAIIYRSSLIYQLETSGSQLENLAQLDFSRLSPVFRKAAQDTANLVLVNDESFYYNTNYSLKTIKKPRAGLIPLAQADYNYQEILAYYYERAQVTSLNELVDSEIKFTANITNGLQLKEIRQFSWAGPRVITVIDYDLTAKQLKLKPVLAQGVVPGREDLSDIIKNNAALAGVNGGYFHYNGRPLGLIYLNKTLVSEPLYNRTSLLINQQGELSFANVSWTGSFTIDQLAKNINLAGINRAPAADEIVLFNAYYGSHMPPLTADYYDIVVNDGKILGVERSPGTATPIPPAGCVLRVGKKQVELPETTLLRNKEISINNKFQPDFDQLKILHAVGGGPRLLKAGKIEITGQKESFRSDILAGRAPRTALGLTADNHLLMLTIDGRQNELSVGMTLAEVAQLLQKLGAVEAMNLDGGGSARMVIRGFTVNNPSEKRLIGNGVIVNQEG